MPATRDNPAGAVATTRAGRCRGRFWTGTALLAIAAPFVWITVSQARSSQPHYQGRPLTYWLSILGNDQAADGGEAPRAIRTIGTNGLPWILRELQARDPRWRKSLYDWINQLPGHIVRLRTETHRRESAVAAFRELRARGKPAMPHLVQLLSSGPDAFSAAEAITAIGPAAIPDLSRGLQDPDPSVRALTTRALGWLARETHDALKPLATAIDDPHWRVRYYAVEGIGHLDSPDTAGLIQERFADEVRVVRVAATNVWNRLMARRGRWLERQSPKGNTIFVFEFFQDQLQAPEFPK